MPKDSFRHPAQKGSLVGAAESGDSYQFYAEGVTPAIARLYEAINAECVAVAAALGASIPTLADWFDRIYGAREATLVETCQRLTYNSDGPYQATGTPKSLAHKFITEDVPTGLIPMSALNLTVPIRRIPGTEIFCRILEVAVANNLGSLHFTHWREAKK